MILQNNINRYTEIYVEGDTWITESKATVFHNFYKNKILSPNETIDDYKEVTEKEKQTLETTMQNWERPPQSFIDEWEDLFTQYSTSSTSSSVKSRWGKFNEETGYFEANGVIDITYAQAIRIKKYKNDTNFKPFAFYCASDIRTNVPMFGQYNADPACASCSYDRMFYDCINIEVINGNPRNWRSEWTCGFVPVKTDKNIFSNCKKLTKINGELNIRHYGNTTCDIFGGTSELQTINLINLPKGCTLLLTASPKLTLSSFKNIVNKANNSNSTATVRVHADVYRALIGEAEYPFNGGSLEEWTQLLQDATDKNITFTT